MSESKSKRDKVYYMFEKAFPTALNSPIDLIQSLAFDATAVWLFKEKAGEKDISQEQFYNICIKATIEELPQEVIDFLYELYKLSETQEGRFSEIIERIRKRIRVQTGMTIYETRKTKESSPYMLQ